MRLLKLLFILVIIILNIYAFTHKRYENLSEGGSPNFFNIIKWKLTRHKAKWPDLPTTPPSTINGVIAEQVSGEDIVATYINHSSFLIQAGNTNIITDPIWSEYAGPYGKYGIKRSIYPGLSTNQLPEIDFILISHAHYDHLDIPTIEELVRINKEVKIITGLGVTKYIDHCKNNKNSCYELNWWDNIRIGSSDTIIHFVPAHHWASRYFFDKDTSLWGGFVIQHGAENIYFSGDTGFGDGRIFQALKEEYGSFRLALLPIGAYKPNWLFTQMHLSPEQAVQIFTMLNSKNAIPFHFDTFQLSDETYQDPISDLNLALTKFNVDQSKFHVMKAGESWSIP